MFGMIGIPELLIVIVIAGSTLVVAWPAGRICRRVGYSPWLGVLAILPIANLCLLWFVAFADWPAQRTQN